MKRTKHIYWFGFGLLLPMILTLTACGGGGGGGGGGGEATQASVVVGGRAGSATQLSSLIGTTARASRVLKSAAGDLDPALAQAKVTLEVIKADGTSTKYNTVTDDNGAYSLAAAIIVGDVVTVTFEKEGYTTFSKTLDTSGTAANEKRQFVVNGKATQTGIIVSTKSGEVFKAGGGTTSGFRFGLMRSDSGVQRAFASSGDVRRAATYDGSKPELDINIPGSWAPEATAITAKLAAFDPADPIDRAMFPGEFVGIGGGSATAGAVASKASVEERAYQLESVSFFSADVNPNVGAFVTPAQASAAGAVKAAVPGNALIYKYIPVDGCTAIQKYADRDPATAGVQVPLYTYKSSTGKWGYLGEGTLATYIAGEYFPAVVANASTSLAGLACGTTDYYFAIETSEWTTWWNLDYPILLEQPKTVSLCGTVVDKVTNGNPVPGANVVADGYAKGLGANSYHSTNAGNDGKFQLDILTGTGKELSKFDFAAYDYSTWPSPSSKNAGGSFPALPENPVTTGCNEIGNVVVPSINTGMIEGTILEELTAATTKPLVNQWVWVESLDQTNYFYNWAQTDADGKFAMKAPIDLDLNVGVLSNSYPVKINGAAAGFEATDSSDKVTLKTVKLVNAAPEVYTWIDPNPAKVGKNVTLSAWAWDPENDLPLAYQWKIDDVNQSTAAEFIWVPTAGEHRVAVAVTDSKGKVKTVTQTLSVAAAGNSLPVIYYTWAAPAATCGGAPVIYANAYDPDGDVLTYTLSNTAGEIAYTVDINGGFVPTASLTGDVLLTVTDTQGGSVTQSIPVPAASQLQIYVAEAWPLTQNVGSAVELYAFAFSYASEGVSYQWTVTAPDQSLISVEPSSVATFTPEQIGDYTIVLSATDGCSSDSRTFTVKVEPVEVILDPTLYDNQQVIVNQPLTLNMGLLNLPPGITFELKDLTEPGAISNGTTMTPTWTPTTVGTHTLELSLVYLPGFPAVKKTLGVLVNAQQPTTGDVTIQ